MTFSLSGSVITQSGTDANLSGLSAIAGVTTVTQAGYYNRTLYVIPENISMVVSGTLSHDPKYEELTMIGVDGVHININGTYNYGGTSEYTGAGLNLPKRTTNHWESFHIRVNNGGVFNWRGGLIMGANVGIYALSGGTINVNGGTVWGAIGSLFGGQDVNGWIGAATGGALNISSTNNGNGLVLYNRVALSMGDNFTVSGINFQKGAKAQPVGGLSSYVRYIDCATDEPSNVLILTYSRKNIFINFKNGTNVVGQALTYQQGQAQFEFYRNLNSTIKSLAGAAIENAVIYIKDVNNGQRKTFTLQELGTQSNQSYTYIRKTNAAGNLATDIKIYLGSVYTPTAIIDAVYDTGTGRYDRRFSDVQGSYVNTDTASIYVWHYGYLGDSFSQALSDGTTGTLKIGRALIADANVTLTESAAGSLTSIASLDNIYDAAKYWKTRDIAAQLEYPSINTQLILPNGTLLDFQSRNLIVDASATNALAVNTGTHTITIKASTLADGTKFKTVAAASIDVLAGVTVSAALAGTVRNAGTITGSVTGDLTNTGTISGSVNGNLIYLSQGAGANLFRYSEQQENAAWLKTRCSITANAAIGPNGKMTAEKLVEDTSNNSHYSYQQVSVTSGVTYTMSCYAKASERSILVMQFHGSNSAFSSSWVFFNLLTGATSIGSGSPTVQMQYVGDGWYRCAITSVATATAFASIQPFGIATSTPSSSYQGDGASGIFITGAQLEASSAVGPYIPTQANAVTLSGQGSLVGTATGDVIYSNGLANTQTLVATTSIMNLPKSGAISTAGSINFGTSTRILPTGNLTASNTAFAGTLTIETATAIDLTLTNCSGQVNLTVTGNGSVRVILGGSTPRTILPTTLPSGVTVAVACSVVDSTGASFNIVARYGTTGAYTDLGYQTNVTSASYLVAYGSPVELCMWRLGYLSFVRTITTTSGGFSLSAEMIAEPDVNTALNVASYLSNITVTSTAGQFRASFNADMDVPDIEYTKAIVHRLLGLEASMRALLPPGTATVLEIEPDEIQINQPAVFLDVGAGANRVLIRGFFNTAPAIAVNPNYVINPERQSDNRYVQLPLTKPALDTGQLALAVWQYTNRTLTADPGATAHQTTQTAIASLATTNQAEHDATQAQITTLGAPMQAGAVVNANIKKVNDSLIKGTGTVNDPWGPA